MVAEKPFIEQFDVKIESLEKGSIITAYTGFGDRYANINGEVKEFVQHNFKGCKLIVVRNRREIKIRVTELESGDQLSRIYDFPPKLQKLTVVNTSLIKALKYRDFSQFDIKKPHLAEDSRRELREIIQLVEGSEKHPSPKKAKRIAAVQQTNEFIQKVRQNAGMREEMSNSVMHAMDNARKGNINIDDIRRYVDSITESASSDALAAIACIKASDQTYAHCVDVGVIFQTVYQLILEETGRKSAFDSMNQAILSAFLHDFGKSKIPKELIETTTRFQRNSQEMQVMMSHPVHGAEILSNMGMPKSIVNMALYHHVKADTTMLSSYPKNCRFEDASFETRLLSIIDVYQALVGRRRYKKSWSPPATMRYIEALSGVEYDYEVWLLFLKIMGMYPKGSLVELSNHSIGFVVSVPKNESDPERPIVAVVKNEFGENLSHHEMVDLEETLDVSIVRDLDNQEVFGSNALDIFMNIEVS